MSSPQLPRNVLTRIFTLADGKTRRRLRAVNTQARADPLMHAPSIRTGLAYGTGPSQLQKLYNDLPRRIYALKVKVIYLIYDHQRVEVSYADLDVLAILLDDAIATYKQAVKRGTLKIKANMSGYRVVAEQVLGRQAVEAMLVETDPESFMRTVLSIVQPVLVRYERQVADALARAPAHVRHGWTNKKKSEIVRTMTGERKEHLRLDAEDVDNNTAVRSRRRRIARRAARRLAA